MTPGDLRAADFGAERGTWAVIAAAGRSSRAACEDGKPKQYRRLGGRPVISRTLAVFARHPAISGILVVIHPDDEELFADAVRQVDSPIPIRHVHGGASRQISCRRGLEALSAFAATPPRAVLIHDAARPFVSDTILDNVVTALEDGAAAALPVVAVSDTLKRGNASGTVVETVARDGLFAAQTPQGFDFTRILAAHRAAVAEEKDHFTDDCALAEWAGIAVTMVGGATGNIKLTTSEDLAMAERRVSAPCPDIRSGNGYDVHRLVAGDHVTLCGVNIPHNRRLDGHSDADVALHALTDALLATCGAGDIGTHFPPSDPQWKGAASFVFLQKAGEIVARNGGTILNVDVSLIAEAPKIGPHRDAMRSRLADILGISVDRCSVKATTNEKMGFIGREEGIAAIATANVSYGVLT
ncbi:bifunctional 2-C-methyl-D-erythritol 4-phosphate cytidylyltransferase/2-C-methyl-D-erythritol 2,4-cyclodiphosphate synthase [Pseudohoeflea coraliihabitans]|uniref:Bifunctional enzyme IspD/IspF n=1 Tax=Pseudohoeflea coraliihabitans TaxID=2860393 RepID=A0ABS6WTS0_9HYPH|nr:bifunctional 2-C-methyl-D-erythritol 4-phosphate cytidylyltransferase/2-C-methyl-D-erythritol 2,4-cyclodiphosphate synthase [Pseudohoeflea sp. DP4N28-3]MBW3098459.1 bifunctional 2-C-methyl-D-erythritol 4-phosphate cytidylyltransferase/2-C-methyl-D-erythritol 2,4-cyclodiphosphate synthase [Pseudohoeflea sp. DP4N28-3]